MDDLLKSAFVGTATLAPPPQSDDPADIVVPELASDAERHLLLRAGARAVWQIAGYQPRKDVVIPEPSHTDQRPELSERGQVLLRLAFGGDARELLPEFLERLDASGLRLPAEILPEALSPTGRSNEVRRLIRKVIGERGRWLARLNPDWTWAANEQAETADRAALQQIWTEGMTGDRVEALKTLRQSDPAEARAWLEATLSNEKADVRGRLIEALGVGLSSDDEPILEQTLSDRSEAVRAIAADLLARLPNSALVARMTARAEAMLSVSRGGIVKRTLQLECTPPQQIEKDWLRDGVPKDASHAGFGPRATWTEAVVGAIPLSYWTTRFQTTPAELVAAAKSDEFSDSIIAGWTRSAARGCEGASEWRPALVDHWFESLAASSGKSRKQADSLKQHFSQQQLQSAVAGLDRAAAETFIGSQLRQNNALGEISFGLLDRLPRPWSVEFTRGWLRDAATALASKAQRTDYKWARSLGVAVSAAPITSLDEIIAVLEPIAADPEKDFSAVTRRMLDVIRLRRDFCQVVSDQASLIQSS